MLEGNVGNTLAGAYLVQTGDMLSWRYKLLQTLTCSGTDAFAAQTGGEHV